jgi:translocator protein
MWFLRLCYFVAFVARFWARPGIPTWYAGLAKPAWPGLNWLFGPVWTILYGLMAVAPWRVIESAGFPVEKHDVDSIWLAVGVQFTVVTCFF